MLMFHKNDSGGITPGKNNVVQYNTFFVCDWSVLDIFIFFTNCTAMLMLFFSDWKIKLPEKRASEGQTSGKE